jgi:hypothetical protein
MNHQHNSSEAPYGTRSKEAQKHSGERGVAQLDFGQLPEAGHDQQAENHQKGEEESQPQAPDGVGPGHFGGPLPLRVHLPGRHPPQIPPGHDINGAGNGKGNHGGNQAQGK